MAIVENWTGPGGCYKAGGYSLFHRDETAALEAPVEVLFFQVWGIPDLGGRWEEVILKDVYWDYYCNRCKTPLALSSICLTCDRVRGDF